jgi:RNA polymerase sigma factor (TIGR02999 family)
MQQTSPEIASLLKEWSAGDQEAFNQLLPIVYTELKRLARLYLRSSSATIQPTALVHEVYLRLLETSVISWQDRAHFFAVVGQLMRHILVDQHRANIAGKRGGRQVQVTLDPSVAAGEMHDVDLLDLDQALTELAELNPRGARLIELRFFVGLSLEETAEVLGVSLATLKRDWTVCRAWIKMRLISHTDRP